MGLAHHMAGLPVCSPVPSRSPRQAILLPMLAPLPRDHVSILTGCTGHLGALGPACCGPGVHWPCSLPPQVKCLPCLLPCVYLSLPSSLVFVPSGGPQGPRPPPTPLYPRDGPQLTTGVIINLSFLGHLLTFPCGAISLRRETFLRPWATPSGRVLFCLGCRQGAWGPGWGPG